MRRDGETRGLFDGCGCNLPFTQCAFHEAKAGKLEFPMARAADPVTSHEAADRVEANGAANTQRATVLRQVRLAPGSTASEIARAIGHATNHVSCRRLPELEAKGLVRRGTPRVCHVTSFRAATWW